MSADLICCSTARFWDQLQVSFVPTEASRQAFIQDIIKDPSSSGLGVPEKLTVHFRTDGRSRVSSTELEEMCLVTSIVTLKGLLMGKGGARRRGTSGETIPDAIMI